MFSVIVPVHDDPLVKEAIASVTAQSLDDLEVIVVDDGCSIPVRLEDCDPRVRVIRNVTASGPAAARNTGVRAAAGDFLAFLDSDDLYRPHRLEAALPGHETADVVVLDPTNGATGGVSTIDSARLLERVTPHLGVTSVLRTAFMPFDESYLACEDIDWWLRVVRAGQKVVTVEADEWCWRRGEHDRVLHGDAARLTNSYRLLEEHRGFFETHAKAKAFRWRRIAAMERRSGSTHRAVNALARSARARPSLPLVVETGRVIVDAVRPKPVK